MAHFNNNPTGSKAAGEPWMHTHAGDMWTATVPRRFVSDASDSPLIVFARAFWGSWPFRIERRILHALECLGILFQTRGGYVGPDGERKFLNTACILDGFVSNLG
jgi:hypothetical protein